MSFHGNFCHCKAIPTEGGIENTLDSAILLLEGALFNE